jgi:SnoaL-like domain
MRNFLKVGVLALGLCQLPAALAVDDAALKALEKQADAVGKRIQKLQDLTEIEIVQHAYGYYVDKAQWRSLSDLFADNATLEIGGKGIFTGKARVFEYMTVGLGPIGPKDGSLIDHQQFQCLPTVHDDGVTGEVRCIAFVMSSGGWGHVYYEDDFIKENGVWKFKKLHAPFNMYAGYKVGWLDQTTINTYPEKFEPWPDLPPSVMYLTYPSYYVEPFHYPNPVTGKAMPKPSPRAGGETFGR